MKRWIRIAWLLVSGAWFVRLQMVPVLVWAKWPPSNPPRGLALWAQILRDWRHSWLFFASAGVLGVGFLFELLGKRSAMYLNVGFYAAYILLWIPSAIALFRGGVQPEGVGYMIAFGGSALVTLAMDILVYRHWKGKP